MNVLKLCLNVHYSVVINGSHQELALPSNQGGSAWIRPLKVCKKDSLPKQFILYVNTLDFIKKHPYTEYIASIKVGYVSLLSRVRKIGNKVMITTVKCAIVSNSIQISFILPYVLYYVILIFSFHF